MIITVKFYQVILIIFLNKVN